MFDLSMCLILSFECNIHLCVDQYQKYDILKRALNIFWRSFFFSIRLVSYEIRTYFHRCYVTTWRCKT